MRSMVEGAAATLIIGKGPRSQHQVASAIQPSERRRDRPQDVVAPRRVQHVAGVEAQHAYAFPQQPRVPSIIASGPARQTVRRAIDGEPSPGRVEVEDVRTDRMLPSEPDATHAGPAKVTPEQDFRQGHLATQAAGAGEGFGGGAHLMVLPRATPSTTLRAVPLPRPAGEDEGGFSKRRGTS